MKPLLLLSLVLRPPLGLDLYMPVPETNPLTPVWPRTVRFLEDLWPSMRPPLIRGGNGLRPKVFGFQ
jgi:hypothetical protein